MSAVRCVRTGNELRRPLFITTAGQPTTLTAGQVIAREAQGLLLQCCPNSDPEFLAYLQYRTGLLLFGIECTAMVHNTYVRAHACMHAAQFHVLPSDPEVSIKAGESSVPAPSSFGGSIFDWVKEGQGFTHSLLLVNHHLASDREKRF